MIREYTHQELINRTIKEVHCDDCDSIIKARTSYTVCHICEKDICIKCVAYDAPSSGDYGEVYCKSCMEIKYKYDSLIKPLEDEIERLSDDMIKECKSKRKKK